MAGTEAGSTQGWSALTPITRRLTFVAGFAALALLAGLSLQVALQPDVRTASPTATATAGSTVPSATASASMTTAPPDGLARAREVLEKLLAAQGDRYGTERAPLKSIDQGYVWARQKADLYYAEASGWGVIAGKASRDAFAAAGGAKALGFPKGVADCSFPSGCVLTTTGGAVYVPRQGAAKAFSSADTPTLQAITNFRDAAGDGDGLAVGANGVLARGLIFRAGKLTPATVRDRLILESLGLRRIFDLRTDYVSSRDPDVTVAGVPHELINVFAVYRSASGGWSSVATARSSMQQMYRKFVTDPAQRRALGRLLREISRANGPVLMHCTEGKDRTGWAVAILQAQLGASEHDVMAEFLRSNDFRSQVIVAEYQRDLKVRGQQYADARRRVLLVEESYLDAGLSEVKARYGSLEKYLTKGLGLTAEELDALASRLTR